MPLWMFKNGAVEKVVEVRPLPKGEDVTGGKEVMRGLSLLVCRLRWLSPLLIPRSAGGGLGNSLAAEAAAASSVRLLSARTDSRNLTCVAWKFLVRSKFCTAAAY